MSDRIAEITARCEAATQMKREVLDEYKFVTNCLEDIPYLLERIAELEEELAQLGTRYPVIIDRKNQVIVDKQAWEKYVVAYDALQSQLAAAQRRAQDARNELCLKCGRYRESHNGACNGCRWKE